MDADYRAPLLSSTTTDCVLDMGDTQNDYLPNNSRQRDAAVVNGGENRGEGGAPREGESPFEFAGLGENPCCRLPAGGLDPFKNDTLEIVGLYEWIKIVLCLPLAAVRLITMGIALAVGFFATKLALLGWKDRQSPMPRWRCQIMIITRLCARLILFCFGYHWIRRKGRPATRQVAPIVVANHISYTDPIFFFYEIFPSFVASESHDGMPFVGTIIRAMQVIYVDRSSPASRKLALSEIKRKVSCDGFPRVMLFPEGTTTNGRSLISFRVGAFVHGCPIQPVVIRYPHVHFDQSWGTIPLLKSMFRMFTQFHNFMEVEYLPVIYPFTEKKEGAVLLAKKVKTAMSKSLNVVQTQHSYGDVMILSRVSEIGLKPMSSYLVEMGNLEKLLNLTILEALGFLDRYLALGPNKSGFLNKGSFLRTFGLGKCALSDQIFQFLDVENEGAISFREFLYASAHLLKLPHFSQLCNSAFKFFDVNRQGFLSMQEVKQVLAKLVPNPTIHDVCHMVCWSLELSHFQSQVCWMFKQLDVDDDDKISLGDFLTCLERNPLLIAVFKPQILSCVSE